MWLDRNFIWGQEAYNQLCRLDFLHGFPLPAAYIEINVHSYCEQGVLSILHCTLVSHYMQQSTK